MRADRGATVMIELTPGDDNSGSPQLEAKRRRGRPVLSLIAEVVLILGAAAYAMSIFTEWTYTTTTRADRPTPDVTGMAASGTLVEYTFMGLVFMTGALLLFGLAGALVFRPAAARRFVGAPLGFALGLIALLVGMAVRATSTSGPQSMSQLASVYFNVSAGYTTIELRIGFAYAFLAVALPAVAVLLAAAAAPTTATTPSVTSAEA